MKRISYILLAAAALVSCSKQPSVEESFETQVVGRATITNSVTATGNVEPVNKVDVGTQVSGIIKHLYVDYNSEVKAGQVIAELDKTTLQAELSSSQANLESCKAELTYQEANYKRIKELFNRKVISDADIEQAEYSYSKAKAAYAKAQSDMVRVKQNLSYATIYSPIDGIVLYRAVEEGQTVASSFNTPTLFTIAKDLTQMRVIANVDEADIGNVKEGLDVEFSVDAFPDEVFQGKVTQVRLQATTTSNVVTYEVVITAPNKDLKLKPGMTANVTIITARASDAIYVPSKALTFRPETSERPHRKFNGKDSLQVVMPDSIKEKMAKFRDAKKVFVKEGGMIHPVIVTTGVSDGTKTEILSGLAEGDTVVTAQTASVTSLPKSPSGNQNNSNPFMPKRPGGNRRR